MNPTESQKSQTVQLDLMYVPNFKQPKCFTNFHPQRLRSYNFCTE